MVGNERSVRPRFRRGVNFVECDMSLVTTPSLITREGARHLASSSLQRNQFVERDILSFPLNLLPFTLSIHRLCGRTVHNNLTLTHFHDFLELVTLQLPTATVKISIFASSPLHLIPTLSTCTLPLAMSKNFLRHDEHRNQPASLLDLLPRLRSLLNSTSHDIASKPTG